MPLSRRSFLRGAATGAATLASLRVGFVADRARASSVVAERRFILIIMRGAVDALGVMPPIGDPDYATLRGKLAFGPEQVLPVNDLFGLTPAFQPVKPWYDDRQLLFASAVSSQYRDRSHFDGQAILESGMSDPSKVDSGWLGRIMKQHGGHLSAVTVDGGMPAVLLGAPRVTNIPPADIKLPSGDVIERMAQVYGHDPRFAAFADEIRDAAQATGSLGYGRPQIQVFVSAAKMLARPDGPRLAVISSEGWDTHSNQGTVDGRMFVAARALADGLASMRESLGEEVWANTVILGVSEFGRTVRVNGSAGTDHGTGGFAFLGGGRINGGRIHGEWPGLTEKALYQNRDLMPVTDVRSLIKAVLAEHLEIAAAEIDEVAFPGSGEVAAAKDLFRT